MHRFTGTLITIAILICLNCLFGCDSGTKRSHKNTPSRDDFKNAESETTPQDTLPPLPPRKMEVFDSSFRNGPRIQFVWAGYDDTIETIWSIKTDGTDLREVADTLMLLSDSCFFNINKRPWRSPDGRWLSYFLEPREGLDLWYSLLIDLKNKTRLNLGKRSITGQFTADSKYLFYWSDGDLCKYNLFSKRKEILPYKPFSNSNEFFFPKDDPIFYTQRDLDSSTQIRKYSADGKVLQDTKFQTNNPPPHMLYISPNGKYFCYGLNSKIFWTSIEAPADTNNSINVGHFQYPLIDNSGNFIYYTTDFRIYRIDTKDSSISIVFTGNKNDKSGLSLYQ